MGIKSELNDIASALAKAEGGENQARIDEIRQVLKLLKTQHRASRKGAKSYLLQLAKEAGHKPPRAS